MRFTWILRLCVSTNWWFRNRLRETVSTTNAASRKYTKCHFARRRRGWGAGCPADGAGLLIAYDILTLNGMKWAFGVPEVGTCGDCAKSCCGHRPLSRNG